MTNIDAPEPKTFNLLAALEGRTYATDTVTVFMDEGLMYAYAKASRDADYDPADKKKEAVVQELLKTFDGIALKFTVRTVPQEQQEVIFEEIEEEFPPQYSPIGLVLPNRKANAEFNARLWALHIVNIEAPDGASMVPSVEDIKALRASAPQVTLEAIAAAIDGLTKQSGSAYEQVVKNPDFLSRR